MKRIPHNRSTSLSHVVLFMIGSCYFGGASLLFGQTSVTAPAITTQPVSYVAEYGADVSFSVGATGTEPFNYQWQKDGINLADYNNVAGSQSATLYLVGVAATDAGQYSVVVGGSSGTVTSAAATLTVNSTTNFSDDFESGLAKWQPVLDAKSMGLGKSVNHTIGGIFSVGATSGTHRIYHALRTKLRNRVRYTFWMYDDGGARTAYGEICGYNGENGYGKYSTPRALLQSLGIGYRTAPGKTNAAASEAEAYDPTKYQGRIFRKGSAVWFNLNEGGAPSRSVGWHLFEIDRQSEAVTNGLSVVDFYVDGVRARRIKGVRRVDLDTIMLGAWNVGKSNQAGADGGVWYDDVTVEALPATFDYQSLANPGPFPDWMVLRETKGQFSDIVPQTVSEIGGAATNGSAGAWVNDGSGISAQGLRGYLEYTLVAPANDAYRIEVEGREKSNRVPAVELPLNISIDGEFLGQFNLPYGATSNGTVHCFTPYIGAGNHTVGIYWDNGHSRRCLHVEAVRLQSLPSSAVYANGMKMWVANRLVSQSGVEIAPPSSQVSPVCVEGRGRYLSMMSMNAGIAYPLSPVAIQPGAGYRWYANVVLSPTKTTRVETSFQNGAFTQTNDIEWQPTDLLEGGEITIRKGDALLFSALPQGASAGAVVIDIAGAGSRTNDGALPVQHQFDQAGTFSVTGTYLASNVSGMITVHVIEATLPAVVPVPQLGWRNSLHCTNVPPGVVFDSDPRLGIGPAHLSAQEVPLGPNGQAFRLWNASVEPEHLLARLGVGGPVLANATIKGVLLHIPPETPLVHLSTLQDGSELIEGTYILSPVLPQVSVKFQLATGGVTFDDGTLSKTLTASDFDSLGVVRVRFVRAPDKEGSVCNVATIYDNEVLIDRK